MNATGAWSANISDMEPGVTHCLPKPSKGIHLVLPNILPKVALLLRAPQDGRVFFVLPWQTFSIVGTTDTFYEGDPDHVSVDPEDQTYLLDALNAYFPTRHYTGSSVVSSFAGLRPLVAPVENQDPSDVPREHVIQISKGGLITILGGKFTTHRLIAEEVVDTVLSGKLFTNELAAGSYLKCTTSDVPLPGAAGPVTFGEARQQLIDFGMDDTLVSHLMGVYGVNSLDLLEIIKRDPREGELISKKYPHIYAEITYGINNEHLKTIEDWFHRSLSVYPDFSDTEYREKVAKKFTNFSRNNNLYKNFI
nr:Aerobic glycerol-3-phosphate dehydrogenase [uncultured bacterium]